MIRIKNDIDQNKAFMFCALFAKDIKFNQVFTPEIYTENDNEELMIQIPRIGDKLYKIKFALQVKNVKLWYNLHEENKETILLQDFKDVGIRSIIFENPVPTFFLSGPLCITFTPYLPSRNNLEGKPDLNAFKHLILPTGVFSIASNTEEFHKEQDNFRGCVMELLAKIKDDLYRPVPLAIMTNKYENPFVKYTA